MHGVAGVEEHGGGSGARKRRRYFLGYEPRLAHAADEQLALVRKDFAHGAREIGVEPVDRCEY